MVQRLQERSNGKAKGGLQGYGKAFQAGSGGVVVSAQDVRALMKGRWSDEMNSWSGMVMLRRPEGEPVTVCFSRTVGALLSRRSP